MRVSVRKNLGGFAVDACFTGKPSGVTALYGPSGSGKTTLVNMIAGLVRPDAGRIAINGRCLFDADDGINLPPEKRRMGYVFQDGRLFPHMSVAANLTYGLKLVPQNARKIRLEQVVSLLGIGHLLERRPQNLSGGEKQRVAIGRALLASPETLLMDEPFASLDAQRKEELLPYIAAISEEFAIPILYVSHALQEIRELTDAVVFLRDGRVVEPDAPAATPFHALLA